MTKQLAEKRKGRHLKVTPQAVLEELEQADGPITKARIAKNLGVRPETIARRFKDLRQDGEPIIPNGLGNQLIYKVETKEQAETIRDSVQRLIGILRGLIIEWSPTAPLLPETKRMLRDDVSPQERKELIISTTRLKALAQQADIEHELSN